MIPTIETCHAPVAMYICHLLASSMDSVLEDIWKHEERMLQAVTERNENKETIHKLERQLAEITSESKAKIHELEKHLAVKEVELKQLQNQLSEGGKLGDLKQVAKAVRKELQSPQLAMENKIMEILEVTREASDQQNKQLDRYSTQMTAHSKQHNEWKSTHQKLLKNMEKSLQKDIATLKRDLQKVDLEWQINLQDQLSRTTKHNLQCIEKSIENAFSKSLHGKTCEGDVSTIASYIKKDVQTALQLQNMGMEKSLQDLMSRQLQKQQQQLQNLRRMLLVDITFGIKQTMLHGKENEESSGGLLTTPMFDEKFQFQQYHDNIKHKLDEMSHNHTEEVKKIQKEIGLCNTSFSSQSCPMQRTEPITAHKSLMKEAVANQSALVYIPTQKDHRLQRRQHLSRAFSPLTSQERASLFRNTRRTTATESCQTPRYLLSTKDTSKSNPSFDVSDSVNFSQLQSHLTEDVNTDNQQIFPDNHSPDFNENILGKSPNIPTKISGSCESMPLRAERTKEIMTENKAKQGKKRKRDSKGNREKKCPGKTSQMQCQESHIPGQQIRPNPALVLTEATIPKKSQEKCCWENDSGQFKSGQQNALCSPEGSKVSEMSSPAVSVNLDRELVLVRRSRLQTYATPKQAKLKVNEVLIPSTSPQVMEIVHGFSGKRSRKKRLL